MATAKQVMIFIVEGPTEETALAQILSRIFSTSQIKFEIVHGDITTERRSNPRERVRGLVLQSLKLNGYRWKDIARIVQIGDTDGAFIPDECVRGSDDGEIHYGEDGICAGNVDVLRERNARKKRAMRELAGISTQLHIKEPACRTPCISSLETWNMRYTTYLKNSRIIRRCDWLNNSVADTRRTSTNSRNSLQAQTWQLTGTTGKPGNA